MDKESRKLFSSVKYRSDYITPATILPMSKQEMDILGWDECDIIIVTGDAYIDHPGFGSAIIGRVLEAHGFRVGIIAQPDWHNTEDFCKLGRPALMFGVTSGNLDSMINNYTADKLPRSDDAFSPDNKAGLRPDRAVITYTNCCKAAFAEIPVIIGGIEASLRRAAHYDYWSEKVRRSILLDSKADMLLYGNSESAVVEIAYRLANGHSIKKIEDIRGTVFSLPLKKTIDNTAVKLPSFEEVSTDIKAFCEAEMLIQRNNNAASSKTLVQRHKDRNVVMREFPYPLSSKELDSIYELHYARKPHPSYKNAHIKAWEATKFSITIHRGCYGGCSFCSLNVHQGRVIQNRSIESVIKEIGVVRDNTPGFTGTISDLGGPSANMYSTECKRPVTTTPCIRTSCLFPSICSYLNTDHKPLLKLYRKTRLIKGIKKITISSGIRYDLALLYPEYIKEIVKYHVGGYLKVAPEHVTSSVLQYMQKPDIHSFEVFKSFFDRFSREAGKKQYLIPYFIAAHPGTSDYNMLELALWLKKTGLFVDQVQTFLPSPMTLSTAMYYTGINPLNHGKNAQIHVSRGLRNRRLQKAFLRYHDADNWPLLREALKKSGLENYIGNSRDHLIPTWQPSQEKKHNNKKVSHYTHKRKYTANR